MSERVARIKTASSFRVDSGTEDAALTLVEPGATNIRGANIPRAGAGSCDRYRLLRHRCGFAPANPRPAETLYDRLRRITGTLAPSSKNDGTEAVIWYIKLTVNQIKQYRDTELTFYWQVNRCQP
ncbi:hypothetical protein [Steroidobacter denitrificans]|uniref:hypothetical protein n=1 Tax=Steroidobacter denitrificans TaxID=465721 RepID=UPI0012ED5B15|nr:hypothetical protein [Steroidobacter denitrificans]